MGQKKATNNATSTKEENLIFFELDIGMPFLKGRSRTKKVKPSNCIETENTPTGEASREKSEMLEKMPPYLSTLKFQLMDLDVDVLKRSDDLEEGVEQTSLPVHKTTRAQSITLPMDMPVVGCQKLRSDFRRKVDPVFNSNDRINRLSAEEWKIASGSDIYGTTVTQTEFSDGLPTTGRWFNDIDKLTSFKKKHRLDCFSREKNQALKEWTTSPRNFYKCILKHRQNKLPCNHFAMFTKEELRFRGSKSAAESSRKVSFPPEVLVFSAIEENMFGELVDILRSNKIDINLCKNSRGLTLLHRAVQLGSVDCVRILINHTADVNIRDSSNFPALDLAIRARQFECAVLLIEAGADIAEYTRQRLQEYENTQLLSKSCYRSFEVNV